MTKTTGPTSLRDAVVAELHARPFPAISCPTTAHFIAVRPRKDADSLSGEDTLRALLAGEDPAPGTAPGSGLNQWAGRIGDGRLKWERHTEFSTFLVWRRSGGEDDRSPFTPDWLERTGQEVIAAARLHVERLDDDDAVTDRAKAFFSNETLAMSRMLEDAVVVAGDFQLDPAGRMDFRVFARAGTGDQRIGRVVQRICEIETYRAMAMLGFLRASELSPDLTAIEREIGAISTEMVALDADPQASLEALLGVAGRIENILARSDFRFAATRAYEAIVTDRIGVLREVRFEGRQTFAEFMSRRFAPAMRTVASTERRLMRLSDRAGRIGELLRTRVEVDRSQENRALLASMDRRSDQALKLQHTVEGLSVVAISYYATGLLLYVAAPFAEEAGISKTWAAAALAPLVVALSWVLLRRLRRALH